MNQSTVFVGGIHGVGKTTICRLLAELLPARHLTAGALIREAALSSGGSLKRMEGKAVHSVGGNQELLLRGLLAFRATTGAGTILLDGHFALLDSIGAVVEVALSVFAHIKPIGVLLVEADDATVRTRLLRRDGVAPSLATIASLADCERACANNVCTALGIPIWRVSTETHLQDAAQIAALHLRSCLTRAV